MPSVKNIASLLLLSLTILIFPASHEAHAMQRDASTNNFIQRLFSPIFQIQALTPDPKPPAPSPSTPKANSQIGIPILMYHYIGDNPNPKDKARYILSTTPQEFTKQMKFLAENGYMPVTLDTLYAIWAGLVPKPENPIVLTFDDGYKDFYFNAFPILKSFNFHAVSFIPTGLIGQSMYMTWEQIKEINSSGLVDFEAHTVNHVNLVTLPLDRMVWEIKQSKSDLESQIGRPVNFFAYPYGPSSPFVINEVKKAGFQGAVGTWVSSASEPSFDMPRIRINGQLSLDQFEQSIK